MTTTTTSAGLEGVIAGESEICFIDGDAGVLSYRGFNIHTLAKEATFEEVIYLLWNGRLPKRTELDALKADLSANRAIAKPVTDFLASVPKAESPWPSMFYATARDSCRSSQTAGPSTAGNNRIED